MGRYYVTIAALLALVATASAQPTACPAGKIRVFNAGAYLGCVSKMDLAGGNLVGQIFGDSVLISQDPATTKVGATVGANAGFAGTQDLTGKAMVGHGGAKAINGGQCSATDCTTGLGTVTTNVFWPIDSIARGAAPATTGAAEYLWPGAGKLWAWSCCTNSAIDAATTRIIDLYDAGAAAVVASATCTIAASTQCCFGTSAGGITLGAGKRFVWRGTGTGTLTARGIGCVLHATVDSIN
jgi:hypothetical protein